MKKSDNISEANSATHVFLNCPVVNGVDPLPRDDSKYVVLSTSYTSNAVNERFFRLIVAQYHLAKGYVGAVCDDDHASSVVTLPRWF